MPAFPAFKTKPYYSELSSFLAASLDLATGEIKDSAIDAKLQTALANAETVTAAAADAVATEAATFDYGPYVQADVEAALAADPTPANAAAAAAETAITNEIAGRSLLEGRPVIQPVLLIAPGATADQAGVVTPNVSGTITTTPGTYGTAWVHNASGDRARVNNTGYISANGEFTAIVRAKFTTPLTASAQRQTVFYCQSAAADTQRLRIMRYHAGADGPIISFSAGQVGVDGEEYLFSAPGSAPDNVLLTLALRGKDGVISGFIGGVKVGDLAVDIGGSEVTVIDSSVGPGVYPFQTETHLLFDIALPDAEIARLSAKAGAHTLADVAYGETVTIPAKRTTLAPAGGGASELEFRAADDSPVILTVTPSGDVQANGVPIGGGGSGPATKPGTRFVALGDSITYGYSSQVSLAEAVTIASEGRIPTLGNSGVNSDTATMMLARFDADVVAYSPNVCLVTAGSNDIKTLSGAAAFVNVEALWDACEANGITPIAALIPPRPTYGQKVVDLNTHIVREAGRRGIPVVDFYSVIVDGLTNAQHADYLADGTHPNTTGTLAMGAAVVSVVDNLLDSASLLPMWNSDTSNLVANGLFITDTDSDGVPDNWTKSGTGTTAYSLVAATKPALGTWLTATTTADAANELRQDVTTGFSAGDVVQFCGRFEADVSGSGVTFRPTLSFVGPGTFERPLGEMNVDASGAWCTNLTVPAGTTALRLSIWATGSGAATYRVAQVGLRNLTALGLV